jgi:succinyl-CoA synthetase alpha subunit
VEGGAGTHASKVKAMRDAGITVVENLSEIGETVAKSLKKSLAA